MKTLSTYRVNAPTTTSGFSITISTTIFGTEEEIEYLKKNCAETIGSGLLQEFGSPLTSQFVLHKEQKVNSVLPTEQCWITGNYTDDCICDFCRHKEECSGYDKDD